MSRFCDKSIGVRPWRVFYVPAAIAGLTLAAGSARAADLLPLGPLEPVTRGRAPTGEVAAPGSVAVGLNIQESKQVIRDTDLALPEAENKELLKEARRVSALFGVAMSQSLQLNLGVHGSYEDVSAQKYQLLRQAAGDQSVKSAQKTDFSGLSAMLTFRVFEKDSFRLALAPFIESGVGGASKYALTRSPDPKAGFAGILTYGERGVGEFGLNSGYRYHTPKSIGGLTVQDEFFYGLSLSGYLTRDFAVIGGFNGRTLKVEEELSSDTDKRSKSRSGGELTAGILAYVSDAQFSIYFGRRSSDQESVGFAKTTAGLNVAFPLGASENKAASGKADDKRLPTRISDDAGLTNAKTQDYPEMSGASFEILNSLEEPKNTDDFEQVKRRIEMDAKNHKGPSNDEKVAIELQKLREAEAKAEQEAQLEEAREMERLRKSAVERSRKEEVERRELMKEANQKARQLDGITKDEMDWLGLEE